MNASTGLNIVSYYTMGIKSDLNKMLNFIVETTINSDNINDYVIYTQEITYKKNENLILTNNNSRAIDLKANIQIDANNFEYNLIENIITAKKNATINNKLKKYTITSNFISYLRNDKAHSYGLQNLLYLI